jgi:hypothetical protein
VPAIDQDAGYPRQVGNGAKNGSGRAVDDVDAVGTDLRHVQTRLWLVDISVIEACYCSAMLDAMGGQKP